ncbi:MAG: hypothetical protein ABSB24_04480 [Gaiellaceae bacterium]
MRRALPFLLVVLAAAGWGTQRTDDSFVPPGTVRPPNAKTDMDTNPANLASAVVTHAFGQLPEYIDGASLRLLPFDLFRAAQASARTLRTYRITTPRTGLVLDTAVTSELTAAEARVDAAQYSIAVSLDGRAVRDPSRYWVFYRNNGPQICRIYFPGDLGSLNMGANSLVLRPLPPGRHLLRVVVRQRIAGSRTATLVTDYVLRVLQRPPNARERASAPPDDTNPAALGNQPLVLRTPRP